MSKMVKRQMLKPFGEEEGRADTGQTQSAMAEIPSGCQRCSTM